MGFDPIRVTEVYAQPVNGPGRVGSGYRVTDTAILTAAHVVAGAAGCQVRPLGSQDWISGSVEWRDESADVAVIGLTSDAAPLSPGSPAPRWGEVRGSEQTGVTAIGFPWAQERRDGTDRIRESEQLFGFISPGTTVKAGYYSVTVRTSRPADRAGASPWAGMSGAALFAGRFLVGVVVLDPPRFEDRVMAVPVAPLLRDASLAGLLGTSPERVTTVGPRFGLQITAETSVVVSPPYRAADDQLGREEPAKLLLSHFGIVPFAGRDRELEELAKKWCLDRRDPALLRLIIGAGGSGKTRLAAEVCLRMAGHGWQAGFADPRAPAERTRLEFDLPTLLVIDDADARVTLLTDLVDRLSYWQDGDPKIRLILLARHTGGWLDALRRSTEGFVRGINDAPLELRDGELTRDERDEHHTRAVRAFASALQRPPIPDGEMPPLPDDAAFANPLLVHMHALLTVCGAQPPTEGADVREQILDGVLDHERRRWTGFPATAATRDETPQQAVTVATLLSPRTQDGTEEAMCVVGDLAEATRGDRAAVAKWLHRLYPGSESRYVAPMRPDLLAEQLLATCSGLTGLVLTGSAGITTPEQAVQVLSELTRAAPNRKVIHDALDVLLRERLPVLLTLAVSDRDGPLPTALDLAVREAPQPRAAAELLGKLPVHSTALALLAADLTGQAVQASREEAERLNIGLAASLLSQSDRLAEVEQRKEALAAIEEAVRIYRHLNETHPGEFIPGLAKSLNSQSMRQADLGHREDALDTIQEAVRIVRRLAGAHPGEFQAELASVLHTQSHRLASLRRPEEALDTIEKAVPIYRRLARTDPSRFQPDLANALNSLAMWQADAGRPEEALETIEKAVDILGPLAEARPDEFRSKLADVRHTQSHRLAELERWEPALDAIQGAVDIYRSLAEKHPASFRPRLGPVLHSQSDRLGNMGRWEKAREAIQEAIDIFRPLAIAQFDFFGPDLAGSLNSLSDRLRNLRQREEALTAIQEAVGIYRELDAKHRDAFRSELASALYSQSMLLADLGRSQEAFGTIEEAVGIYRSLMKKHPESFGPNLAEVLQSESHRLAGLGRSQEALDTIKEAARRYRQLAKTHPCQFEPRLANVLHDQSDRLWDLGRAEEAVTTIRQAARIYRQLAKTHPDEFLPNLAGSLNRQAMRLADAHRPEEALGTIQEAVQIFKPLADARPDEQADLLHTRACRLADLERPDEALDAINEAVSIYRQLADRDPDAFGPRLADVRHTQSVLADGAARGV